MNVPNKFFVGAAGAGIAVMNPPRVPISKEDALNLAAHLVVLSMASDEEFKAVLEAVQNN